MSHALANRLDFLTRKYNEYNQPMYLSYPVDTHWRQDTPMSEIATSLSVLGSAQVYVHIPFCRTICYYCCCDRVLGGKEEDKELYIDALEKEMELKLSGRASKLVTDNMHWGGGTPAYLSEVQIERLYGSVSRYIEFTPDARIKLEAYPDKRIVTASKLRLLKKLGFNYISFGVQDFDKRVLSAIHRDCDLEETRELIGLAKSMGFIVNVDLCYGLPYQGLGEFERTLQEIVKIAPDKIVAFPYAHYPAVYPLQRKIPLLSLPNPFIVSLLYDMARQYLAADYEELGSDTFIHRNGRETHPSLIPGRRAARDFMGSSEETSHDLLGLGKSAVSKVGGMYYKNVAPLDKYHDLLGKSQLPVEHGRTHALNADDLIREEIILKNLLGGSPIDKAAIRAQFGVDFDVYFSGELALLRSMEKDGLLEGTDTPLITVTELGKHFVRTIAFAFDVYYKSNKMGENSICNDKNKLQ
ncbi:coproporphyrinogen-III oxidase family protein [Paenibacillus lutimineralis]|uniref:Coproporphyrinogen-III oxidase n=1 Tax=Paenibacillus lutimineralis TaxID=2707005 RepID=A0A3S9UVD3_9BACL|nr:radical SAM protein [Paenibacillus lutimineralis]AZS14181.1 coproporphyrinogen dehydrogenase [Paenibacillus lutimineralis]